MKERGAAAMGNLSPIGSILREWRRLRRMSQLELAAAARVSPRHVSFVETGRAAPSREMVVTLARTLDVPLRERNAMLTAAGYAPFYRETSLDQSEMAEMRRALELLLRQHEPFFAVALDRRWDMVMCNGAYARFLAGLGGTAPRPEPYRVLAPPRPNALKLLLGPLRPVMANWEEVARAALERAQREAATDRDPVRRRLVEECLRAAPPEWPGPRVEDPPPLALAVELRIGDRRARLFGAIATLGTPLDITLQELRIESYHPVDAASERAAREWSAPAGAAATRGGSEREDGLLAPGRG